MLQCGNSGCWEKRRVGILKTGVFAKSIKIFVSISGSLFHEKMFNLKSACRGIDSWTRCHLSWSYLRSWKLSKQFQNKQSGNIKKSEVHENYIYIPPLKKNKNKKKQTNKKKERKKSSNFLWGLFLSTFMIIIIVIILNYFIYGTIYNRRKMPRYRQIQGHYSPSKIHTADQVEELLRAQPAQAQTKTRR